VQNGSTGTLNAGQGGTALNKKPAPKYQGRAQAYFISPCLSRVW
jgi:hypothetical protein